MNNGNIIFYDLKLSADKIQKILDFMDKSIIFNNAPDPYLSLDAGTYVAIEEENKKNI